MGRKRKIKPGPAKTWALPHGEGQGPRPGHHTLPPLKAKREIESSFKKGYG